MIKFATSLSIFAIVLAASNISANQSRLIGEAVDQKTGELLYTEVHTFISEDGKKMNTSYRSRDNSEIATRTVSFLGDRVSRYSLALNNINYKESVVRERSGLEFQIEEADSSEVKEQVNFKEPESIVIDAGINNFMLRNWDAMLAGNTLQFDFASTAQLDTVKLQVKLDKKRTTEDLVIFSMTAANVLFRVLLKPIKVGFYRDSRQLAYYRGVSNLKDDEGEAYKVEITFVDGQLRLASNLVTN